jgi:hypothetical protein
MLAERYKKLLKTVKKSEDINYYPSIYKEYLSYNIIIFISPKNILWSVITPSQRSYLVNHIVYVPIILAILSASS